MDKPMSKQKYKLESYGGYKITFEKNGYRTIIGMTDAKPYDNRLYKTGGSKAEVFAELKTAIDKYGNRIKSKEAPVRKTDGRWAGEILKQLGGNKFIAMTGAKNFVRDDSNMTISFSIGRNAHSINGVRIRLTSMDLYDMTFIRMRKFEFKEVSHAYGIYNDQLQEIFTQHTGLETHF